MPNWVKNRIVVSCDKATMEAIKEFVASEESEFDFEKIIPMPSNVYRGDLGIEEERKYPGDLNWFDWSWNHWRTKWNACNAWCSKKTLNFETAWSAPEPVIAELAKKFPNAKFTHKFADEDIGHNCGVYVYKNGKLESFDDRECDYEFAYRMWND